MQQAVRQGDDRGNQGGRNQGTSARAQGSQGQEHSGDWQGRSQRGEGDMNLGEDSFNIAELAIRGTSMLFDIQMSALRSLWQMQARSAAALGVPDCSQLLRSADDGAQRVLASSTEQAVASARQATQAIAEMQRQFGRIFERGTNRMAEEMRRGIEELTDRTHEGLSAVRNIARESGEQGERMMDRSGGEPSGQGRGRSGARQPAGERGTGDVGFESSPGRSQTRPEAGEDQAQHAQEQGGEGHGEAQGPARPGRNSAHEESRGGRASKRH